MKISLIYLSLLLSFITATVTAQNTPRAIGVVDVAKVFDEYHKVKDAKPMPGNACLDRIRLPCGKVLN